MGNSGEKYIGINHGNPVPRYQVFGSGNTRPLRPIGFFPTLAQAIAYRDAVLTGKYVDRVHLSAPIITRTVFTAQEGGTAVVRKRAAAHIIVQNLVKSWYGACQAHRCLYKRDGGKVLNGAHIVPQNADNADTDNILCLCPNHHSIFDTVRRYSLSELRVLPGHNPSRYLGEY